MVLGLWEVSRVRRSQGVLLTMRSGGRMCVGSHLAVYRKCWPGRLREYTFASSAGSRDADTDPFPEMKYIVAALYSSYSTTIVDDAGIEQMDAYTAPPKSDKLIVKLEKLFQKDV